MKNILTTTNRRVLDQFAASDVLLAFDYDGTLAPIVVDPTQARMRQPTRALLETLTRLYRVIVISGRAQPDALRRVRGVGVFEVIGNHGMEPWSSTNRHAATIESWRAQIHDAIALLEDVTIEDKIFSLAIHYRRSREKGRLLKIILKAAGNLVGARIVRGKDVVNIVPTDAPHKGTALERQRKRLGCEKAIYVGDDETDEDVFKLHRPGRLLPIRVGRKRSSAARFYVSNQHAVDDLLRALIGARRRPRARAP